jgi:hypothetical protein
MFYGSFIFNFVGALVHFLFYNIYASIFGKEKRSFKIVREGVKDDLILNMGYQSFHNFLGIVTIVLIAALLNGYF